MAGLGVVLPVQEIEPLWLGCPARDLCLALTELSRLFHVMYSDSAWTVSLYRQSPRDVQ